MSTSTQSGHRSTTAKAMIVACLAALATLFATTAPAMASALGTSGWGWVSYNGVGGPRGIEYTYISGSGNYVSYVKSWPYMTTPVSGSICNWNVTAEFFDSTGHWYKTYTGPTHYTCNTYFKQASADVISIKANMKTGRMCSTLKQNGSRLTSVCHSIHP